MSNQMELQQLELVASITPGTTILTNNMSLVDHNLWSTTASRMLHRESRFTTIAAITTIFEKAFQKYEETHDFLLINGINGALDGFFKLIGTYVGDTDVEMLVKQISDDIIARVARVLPHEQKLLEQSVSINIDKYQSTSTSYKPFVIPRYEAAQIHPLYSRWSRLQIQLEIYKQLRLFNTDMVTNIIETITNMVIQPLISS